MYHMTTDRQKIYTKWALNSGEPQVTYQLRQDTISINEMPVDFYNYKKPIGLHSKHCLYLSWLGCVCIFCRVIQFIASQTKITMKMLRFFSNSTSISTSMIKCLQNQSKQLNFEIYYQDSITISLFVRTAVRKEKNAWLEILMAALPELPHMHFTSMDWNNLLHFTPCNN